FELALEDAMTLCMRVAYGVTVLFEDLPVCASHGGNDQLCEFSLIQLQLFNRIAISQIVQVAHHVPPVRAEVAIARSAGELASQRSADGACRQKSKRKCRNDHLSFHGSSSPISPEPDAALFAVPTFSISPLSHSRPEA